jgi:hypothetical protein
MRNAVRSTLVWLVVLVLASHVRADGKYYTEKVPPNLPYQKALLLFRDHTETLMVQSQYDLTPSDGVDSVGWVVPAPAATEVANMDADLAYSRFAMASHYTQPRLLHVSMLLCGASVGAFLVSLAWLLSCCGRRLLLGRRETWRQRVGWSFMATYFSLVFIVAFAPGFSGGDREVEVIEARKAGLYDVRVIRGKDAGAIMDWLTENGFACTDNDEATFAGYVARGWCFVAAKVRPGADAQASRITHEGLADPLVLTFAADKPVYPLALTATTGAKTEMLIYTVSDTKLTCGDRLKLCCAHPIESAAVAGLLSARIAPGQYEPLAVVPNRMMMLCKFKGTMTAAQMARDLEFEPASDNTPFRERKIVW